MCARVKPILSLCGPPELATHCFFVAHGRKASVLWSRDDYRALCHRMLNGNPDHDFLMCYRDKQGNAKFSKARKAKASKRIDWAFDSISGTGSGSKTGIGFFASNGNDESCWGALDFDAHDEAERSRAYALAGKAFVLLAGNPDLWVISGTSGQSGGWHIFVFTAHFYSTAEWSRLLREVADKIEAPIQKGLLEIFPDGRSRGLGYGVRAPGSWNPKDDSCGLINFDGAVSSIRRLSLPLAKEKKTALSASSTTWEEKRALASNEIFRGEHGEWKDQFAITAPRSRHDKMTKLAGTIFFQAAKQVALENVRLQYAEANPAPLSSLDTHLAEFEELWAGMERNWRAKLSSADWEKFDALAPDTLRNAFRVIRNWSQADAPDFKIVCESLAKRLGVSLQTASNIRRRFCSLGILRKTAEYVPHKLACRYQWIAANKHSHGTTNQTKGQNYDENMESTPGGNGIPANADCRI